MHEYVKHDFKSIDEICITVYIYIFTVYLRIPNINEKNSRNIKRET